MNFEQRLENIKKGYIRLFEELVDEKTSDERRHQIVAEIHDLSEMTRLVMVLNSAEELKLD